MAIKFQWTETNIAPVRRASYLLRVNFFFLRLIAQQNAQSIDNAGQQHRCYGSLMAPAVRQVVFVVFCQFAEIHTFEVEVFGQQETHVAITQIDGIDDITTQQIFAKLISYAVYCLKKKKDFF